MFIDKSKDHFKYGINEWTGEPNKPTFYNKEIALTNDDNYTHAIIINTCMPELNIPKENVIGFAHEPNPILFGY
jgi:hypothetical protein